MKMMECDEESPFDIILSPEQDRWLQATTQVKRLVIGSNRQKADAVQHGILPRLLEWLIDESVPQELRTEAAVVLGSLAWGTEENIQHLVNAGAVPVLLRGLSNTSLAHVEACLRCLRTVFMAPNPPVNLIYQDATIIPHLLNIISRTAQTKEAIANILANCCTCLEHQNTLCKTGAISALAPLLTDGTLYKIQMPVLKCFAAMCYQNPDVCAAVASATFNGVSVPQLIGKLQCRDKTSEMQMASAKCLTFLHRGGAISAKDRIIVLETLPTLVRMCKKDRTLDENVEGAETLSYLIQEDQELQKITSVCDHSMKALAEYLTYTDIQQLDSRQTQKKAVNWGNALRTAAFQAFAAIGANDEEIRKKIIAIDNLIESVVAGMNSDDLKVQVAACRCLHSLSRSVQQIRTTFQDHAVWKPLVKLMQSHSDDVLKIASSTMCNLLLDFSPSKEDILECGAIDILTKLCAKEDEPPLRLNGVWGLMNLAFNSEQKVKMEIVEKLGSELLFVLLSERDPEILMRTLGLLRNLLSKKQHIDNIMMTHGTQVLQAIKCILEADYHSADIKEQTLCVVANIADGPQARMSILRNDGVMKQMIACMQAYGQSNLQIASLYGILNFINGEDADSFERFRILREKGVYNLLQKLMHSKNPHVYERAKHALNQFPST
ncbi:armadillo repeat-containing protein 8-like [Littorina saxatilis]|uniref:Armadillo repeat-containing protein 8 n=1 Tax=Littorina saxatilis TaxID=31220 RepID=A0AAN9BX92_9CAEN